MTRTINIPGESSFWGYEGEHNATVLVVALPDTFTGYLSISAGIQLKNDTVVIIEDVPVADNAARITLTSQMTEFSGVLKLQLVAYGSSSTIIAKSPVYVGYLAKCVNGTPVPVAQDTLAAYFNNTLVEYEFPDGTTSVPNSAFSGKSTLRKLTLPTSITSIAQYALRNNSSALEIYFKGTAEEWSSISFVTTGWVNTVHNLYCNGQLVTEPGFPDGATRTSNGYAYAKSITSVSLPAGITQVMQGSFQGCTSLANATFNEGLITIQTAAFESCALRSIKFPSTLTSIGTSAFYNNKNLSRVDCTELGVENGAVKTSLVAVSAFQVTNAGLLFTFATQAIRDVYASATNWSSYASRMTWEGA